MRCRLAAFAACLPVSALAGDGVPDLRFQIGAGLSAKPEYFGSDDYVIGPTGSFRLGYADVGGLSFGALEDGETRGFSVGGAFRFLGARDPDDYPELTGLTPIDATAELGLGVSYMADSYEVFGEVRYGIGGHEALVGTLGADAILRPDDRWTLRAGPRIEIGSSDFNQTWFGVSDAEAAASGFSAFDAGSGVYSVGLALEAEYEIDEVWSVAGSVGYDLLVGDAADSPIVGLGDDDRYTASIVLRRWITLDF